MSSEVIGKRREVNRSTSSHGVPSRSAIESILAASGGALASSAALVVTNSDVVEDGGIEGVEERVEEAKGALTLGFSVSVNQGDHGAEDRGGGGSSGNLIVVSSNDHVVGVTEGSDVRVGTSSGVKHGSRREISSGAQIFLNGRSLPRGLPKKVRETSTRGDDGSGVGLAGGFRLSGFRAHGGTNDGDVGAVGGVLRLEATLGGVGAGFVAGDSVISGGGEDGQTSQTHLASLGVESNHVGNILKVLGTTIADGEHLRRGRVLGDGLDEVEEDVSLLVVDAPVDGRGGLSHSHDVLNIQISLSAVVRVGLALLGVVGANDGLDALEGDVVGVLELSQVVRRVGLAEGLEDGLISKRIGVSLIGHVVSLPDELRSDGTIGTRVLDETSDLHVLGVNREVLDAVDRSDKGSDIGGDGVGLRTNDLGAARGTGKVVELGIEHLLELGKGSLHPDELSVRGDLLGLSGDVVLEEEGADSVDGFLVPGELTDLLEGVVLTIARGARVRDGLEKGVARSGQVVLSQVDADGVELVAVGFANSL